MEILRVEVCLRICAMLLLVLTACLVGFNTQTKLIFVGYSKKATFRDLDALFVLVWIDTAAAAYNLLHLLRSVLSSSHKADLMSSSYITLAWLSFFFDQEVVYVVFAANSAAITASALAVTGNDSFQWMKLCDRFTRFCFQIGGALLCGQVAALSMALLSSLSAFTLFRRYSPKHFLRLKAKQQLTDFS